MLCVTLQAVSTNSAEKFTVPVHNANMDMLTICTWMPSP